MHVHNVYFWLRQDLDRQELAAFEEGLEALAQDPAVQTAYFGKPADTRRGVVDSSYSYGLVLAFENRAGHDRYQAGPAHLKFLEEHTSKWERVLVYDIQSG